MTVGMGMGMGVTNALLHRIQYQGLTIWSPSVINLLLLQSLECLLIFSSWTTMKSSLVLIQLVTKNETIFSSSSSQALKFTSHLLLFSVMVKTIERVVQTDENLVKEYYLKSINSKTFYVAWCLMWWDVMWLLVIINYYLIPWRFKNI